MSCYVIQLPNSLSHPGPYCVYGKKEYLYVPKMYNINNQYFLFQLRSLKGQ